MRERADDELAGELDEDGASASPGAVAIECPYCGESVEIFLDPDSHGEMVHDCEVCCRPWQLTVRFTRDGRPQVRVEPG